MSRKSKGIPKLNKMPDEKDFQEKGIRPFKPKNDKQAEGYSNLVNNRVVFLLGKVGSGKTYLATHYAMTELIHGNIDKIIVLRPTVAAEEDLGYLKGDLVEKVAPYLASMVNIMEELVGKIHLEKLLGDGDIEMNAVGFQRGLTHKKSIVLVDEIQNMTPNQLRLVLTRIGRNSKIILMGDGTQRDLDHRQDSAIDSLYKFINKRQIGFTIFDKKDCVRDFITKIIESCYEEDDNMITDFQKYGHLVYPEIMEEYDHSNYNQDMGTYDTRRY